MSVGREIKIQTGTVNGAQIIKNFVKIQKETKRKNVNGQKT